MLPTRERPRCRSKRLQYHGFRPSALPVSSYFAGLARDSNLNVYTQFSRGPEATLTLALNEFGEPGLGGWWAGLIIGFVIVAAIVVVVGAILMLASQIRDEAVQAVGLLEVTRDATQPLHELRRTNELLQGILSGAATARKALGG